MVSRIAVCDVVRDGPVCGVSPKSALERLPTSADMREMATRRRGAIRWLLLLGWGASVLLGHVMGALL